MSKIKLTKNELKRQKDNLKRFRRYLPTLILKKKQLQTEIARMHRAIENLLEEINAAKGSMGEWVAVFSENINIREILNVEKVVTSTGNIAGIDIPVYERVGFNEKPYDLIKTPLWVDGGIIAVKKRTVLNAKKFIIEKQIALIKEELRITTQRVNLFEKVKIPETRENIRRIGIFLGDLGTAAVVTGKIAKSKIEKKEKTLLAI